MSLVVRTIVRTARTFDGTTSETPEGYSTDPRTGNWLRTYKRVIDSVGSWSSELLHNPDRQRGLAIWVRLIGTPEVGTSRVEIRSAKSGDTDAGYVPANHLLATHPLTTTWAGPYKLGPTDRVCPIHQEPAAAHSTIEYRVVDLVEAVQVGLVRDFEDAPDDDDDTCCLTSAITVTESTTLDPWVGTRYVFIDTADTGFSEIQMPPLAAMEVDSTAVFVRIGGGLTYVGPNAGDPFNGRVDHSIELDGFIAVPVTAREATWVAEKAVGSIGANLANAVADAEINIPRPTAPSYPVRLGLTARTILRLPDLNEVPVGDRIPLTRTTNGTSLGVLVPQAGQRLQGEVDGRAYIGSVNGGELLRTSVSWVYLDDGLSRSPRVTTVAAGAFTVEAFGGIEVVRATEAGAQAGTLPLAADCQPNALLIIESVGGTKTMSRSGADVINGKGAAAATSVAAATGVNLYLRPTAPGIWSVI